MSMLKVLAGEVSDYYLPEAFFEKLFTQVEGNPTRSADEEKLLAMSLGLKIRDEEIIPAGETDSSDDDEDEDDDEEKEEEENEDDDEVRENDDEEDDDENEDEE